MEISNQQIYDYFYRYYGQINFWPLPYDYSLWYNSLSQQFLSQYAKPEQYILVYEWTLNQLKNETKLQNSKKLSRGQKRRLKKKQLQQQYDSQKKAIGKWVQKQRKDLVNALNKIQQQQKKRKQKKQQKLSHLIQIHKQVRKHHLKKNKQSLNEKLQRKGRVKNKKKRMSYIKKMKIIYESKLQKNKIQNHPSQVNSKSKQDKKPQQKVQIQKKQPVDDDFPQLISQKKQSLTPDQFLTQSDQEEEKIQNKQKQLQQNKIVKISSQDIKVNFPIEPIKYNVIGKLTGVQYHGFLLRQWVTNMPSSSLQETSLNLINRLAYKQAIKKVNKPQKAKKLIVSGVNECKRTLTTILDNKRSKIIFIALNIQRNDLTKGIDDQIQLCIQEAKKIKIPIVHVSTRARLGRAFTGKFGPRATIISIINYEGYQDIYQELKQRWQESCKQYEDK